MSSLRFKGVRAALGSALLLALQNCSIDERDFDVTPEGPGLDGLGMGGTDGAAIGGSSGTSTTAIPSGGEQGPQPVGLTPPDDADISPAGAMAGAGSCLEGSSEPCGPEREEGICRFGTRSCEGGVWGECAGAVLPGARDCSSDEDSDCDGQPDNTLDDVCRCLVGGTQACDEHPELDGKGPCRAGSQACELGADSSTSDWASCVGSVGPDSADSCDVPGDDADCDGTPNGDCSCVEGQTVPCGPDADEGICQRGTSTCTNGAFGACQGAVFPARRDCSSALDNDCDGQPDDNIDSTCTCALGARRACGAHPGRDGNGPCRAGTQLCVAGAQNASSSFGACTGGVGPAQRDSCTVFGDDSDCNGTPNSGCQCVAGRGNQPCAGDPNNSRCNAQGQCAPCQNDTDCSLVSGGRNLCRAGVCSAPRCGDGIVQPGIGETCDDGNTISGDGCSKGCVVGHAPRGSTAFASTHLCSVLVSGGVVSCWGLNVSGQLGNGSTSTTLQRPTLAAGISNAVDVAVRGNDSCALRADGTVACWGANFGTRPVNVSNATSVTQLAGGMDAFCGRQSTGRATCWTTSSDAAQLSGVDSIVQVARGDRHSCVLRNDGALFCQGGGTEGERGDGTMDSSDVLVRATVFADVVQVATGYRSTCVRTRNSGFVQCVGTGATAGSPAALPNGNTRPVTALSLSNAVKVVAGEQHMCALTDDERVVCWGTGLAVGNGSASGSASPVVVPLPGAAIDVGAGSFTSCVLLADTSTYCWGSYAPIAESAAPALIAFP